MRFLPLLTAMLVMVALYALVVERDAVLAFAGNGTQNESVATTAQGDASADAADGTADGTGAAAASVSVVALRSTAHMIDAGLRLRGRTEAIRQVQVRAETSALVVSEPLRKGAYVEAGDLLCQLDTDTRDATLAEARARLEEARINQRAAKKLVKSGFASETRFASTDAALRAAQASVDRAVEEIDRLRIRAPFAGHLETDTAEIGTLLQPGALCATVIQLNPMRLVGYVPETEVERVRLGARARANLASGREVSGRVTFLARSADATTRTFRVDIEVGNADFSIRDGQTAEIFVETDGQSAHLLPASALTLNDAGDLGVRLVAGTNGVRFAPVALQRDSAEGVYLTGLPETASVIVVGQEYVTEASHVSVTYREPE